MKTFTDNKISTLPAVTRIGVNLNESILEYIFNTNLRPQCGDKEKEKRWREDEP